MILTLRNTRQRGDIKVSKEEVKKMIIYSQIRVIKNIKMNEYSKILQNFELFNYKRKLNKNSDFINFQSEYNKNKILNKNQNRS